MVTAFTLCGVGIIFNALLLWVWMGQKTFNAITFLFKYLAVWDTIYLALFPIRLAYYVGESSFPVKMDDAWVAHHTGDLAQYISIHTTLLIAVSRWIAVAQPFRLQTRLQVRRVIAACAVVFLWCSLLKAPEIAAGKDKTTLFFIAMKIVKYSVGHALPCLVLLYFSIGIFREILRHSREKAQSGLGGDPARGQAVRYLLPVSVISVSTFMAYFVGNVIVIGTYKTHGYGEHLTKIAFVVSFMQLTNSSMNFFVYWSASSRFRELLRMRLTRVNCGPVCVTREHRRVNSELAMAPQRVARARDATATPSCTNDAQK